MVTLQCDKKVIGYKSILSCQLCTTQVCNWYGKATENRTRSSAITEIVHVNHILPKTRLLGLHFCC